MTRIFIFICVTVGIGCFLYLLKTLKDNQEKVKQSKQQPKDELQDNPGNSGSGDMPGTSDHVQSGRI
jgi:hypothetical protein